MAAIDLTTVAKVKDRIGNLEGNSNADQSIADAITAFSQMVLTRTGVASFNTMTQTSETRDGNNNDTMFVRNPPINAQNASAVVVIINGYSVPQAGAWPSSGWYISNDLRAIKLRGAFCGGGGGIPTRAWFGFSYDGIRANRSAVRGFPIGQGNVQLSYPSGYGAVPVDLEYAVRCVVAINYKRGAWQDMASKSVSAGGANSATTRYRDWAWPPEYEEVFEYYTRKAVVG